MVAIRASIHAFLLAAVTVRASTNVPNTCENTYITGDQDRLGYVTSPNYPQGYADGQRCSYFFTAPDDHVVHLDFVDFDLEDKYSKSEQCLSTFVMIVVTDREGREHVGPRHCGQVLPAPFKTMQTNVTILFVAAHSSTRRGFRIKYEFVPEADVGEPLSFYGDSDLRFRKQCGGRNNEADADGEIVSPGFPHIYPRNVSCNWLIRVPYNHRIYIRIIHLELSPTMAGCDKASLYIGDGYTHELLASMSARRWMDQSSEMRFCGGQLYYSEEGMKSYLSTGNRVIIRFVTTDSPTAEQLQTFNEEGLPIGFKLLWTEVKSLVDEKDPECDGFTCRGGEFCIDNGHQICAERMRLCINETLQCNGINNCAENDNSDESKCYSNHIFATAATAFSVLLVFTVVLIILHRLTMRREIKRRLRQRAKQLKQSVQSDQKNGKKPQPSKPRKPSARDILEPQPVLLENTGNPKTRRLSPAFFTWSKRTSMAESPPLSILRETNLNNNGCVWQKKAPAPPKVRLQTLDKPLDQDQRNEINVDLLRNTYHNGNSNGKLTNETNVGKMLRLPHTAIV